MAYTDLVTALKTLAIPVAEDGWTPRPKVNTYAVVQLDFEAEDDNGDDVKQARAWEGSVDLFTHGKEMLIVAAVESVLEEVCEGSWYINSEQYEHETGLIHREFVFQLEAR